VTRELERSVEAEQMKGLPDGIRGSISDTLDLSDQEQAILKDADYLECAFQAKEYLDVGYKGTASWLDSIEGRLKTGSARGLLSQLRKQDSNSWWKGLKRLD
jgi:5'-deoxynucleotidase YfbR-like HD superfamily hydrolase